MSPNVNARGVVRCGAVLSWIAAIVAVARNAAAVPPPLSAETGVPSIDSTYGSGNFGTWRVDASGVRTWAGAASVRHRLRCGDVVFRVDATPDTAPDFAVTWRAR